MHFLTTSLSGITLPSIKMKCTSISPVHPTWQLGLTVETKLQNSFEQSFSPRALRQLGIGYRLLIIYLIITLCQQMCAAAGIVWICSFSASIQNRIPNDLAEDHDTFCFYLLSWFGGTDYYRWPSLELIWAPTFLLDVWRWKYLYFSWKICFCIAMCILSSEHHTIAFAQQAHK